MLADREQPHGRLAAVKKNQPGTLVLAASHPIVVNCACASRLRLTEQPASSSTETGLC
jgi:hypothetical protein